MDSTIFWRIILVPAVIMCFAALIMTFIKNRNSDIEEMIVNNFKDVSIVIIIPTILTLLDSDKDLFVGVVSLILFTIILIWCNCWPLIRKRKENKNKDIK